MRSAVCMWRCFCCISACTFLDSSTSAVIRPTELGARAGQLAADVDESKKVQAEMQQKQRHMHTALQRVQDTGHGGVRCCSCVMSCKCKARKS